MREDEAAYVLSELGYLRIKIGDGKVTAMCSCSTKSPTFVVILSGSPGYYCHRCRMSGPLLGLVWKRIILDRRPYTRALMVCNEAAEHYRESRSEISKMDYKPFADRSVMRVGVSFESKPVTGVQIDLSGRDVEREEKVIPIQESYLDRFIRQHEYMYRRGFSDRVLSDYGVSYNMRGRRVVFPIRDWDGVLVGVSQRKTWEKGHCFKCQRPLVKASGAAVYRCECGVLYAKYLHNKGFKKSSNLYGEHMYKTGASPVFVEGMTDVLNLYDKGIRPDSAGAFPLAVMGDRPSFEQVERVIYKIGPGVPIFVVRDNDDPSNYPELPEGCSPGDTLPEQLRRHVSRIDSSRKVYEYRIQELGKDPGDMTTGDVAQLIAFIGSKTNIA